MGRNIPEHGSYLNGLIRIDANQSLANAVATLVHEAQHHQGRHIIARYGTEGGEFLDEFLARAVAAEFASKNVKAGNIAYARTRAYAHFEDITGIELVNGKALLRASNCFDRTVDAIETRYHYAVTDYAEEQARQIWKEIFRVF